MWETLNFLVGSWQGTGTGRPGDCQVERTYEFVLDAKFLHIKNKSTYPPQEQNPQGQIHEDWGFFSYDNALDKFVYRQFHNEGFVNHYVLQYLAPDSKTITFVAESIENIPAGWRGRETYRVLGPDEFIETFELAAPGQNFEIHVENHLKRAS